MKQNGWGRDPGILAALAWGQRPWELLGSRGKAQRGHGPHHSPFTPRTEFGPAVKHAHGLWSHMEAKHPNTQHSNRKECISELKLYSLPPVSIALSSPWKPRDRCLNSLNLSFFYFRNKLVLQKHFGYIILWQAEWRLAV